MSKENRSYIDENTGKIVLRSADDRVEWILSEDSILIAKDWRPKKEGKVISMSELTKVQLHTETKKRFLGNGTTLLVSSGDTWNTIAAYGIAFDISELDIFQAAHDLISAHIEVGNAAPEKQRSLSSDKRPEGDRSYIDRQTGEVILRSYNYQQNPKKKGKQWCVSGSFLTVNEYGFGASNHTYATAQITKVQLDDVTQKSLFGQMRIYVNGGATSAIGGTTLENKPTEFIHYYAHEHDIALEMRKCILGEPATRPAATPSTAAPASKTTPISVADELMKLKGLLDDGVLTQEEFDHQKKKILEE